MKIEKGELPLECSEGAAAPAEGPPALEGAPPPLEGVVSTSAPDSEAVFAAWSRMTTTAVKTEPVCSQETGGELIIKKKYIYIYICGCTGSSLLNTGFL